MFCIYLYICADIKHCLEANWYDVVLILKYVEQRKNRLV